MYDVNQQIAQFHSQCLSCPQISAEFNGLFLSRKIAKFENSTKLLGVKSEELNDPKTHTVVGCSVAETF